MTRNNERIEQLILETINKLFELYLNADDSLVIDEQPINLKHEKIKRISFNNDADFYFKFFNSISAYRERLKQRIADSDLSFLFSEETGVAIESRIKNINSISSKIYQYINVKSEKGDVPINKCINDLFGVRMIIPCKNLNTLREIIEKLAKEHNWNCKINDASKQKYKAIHMYLLKDNRSLRWEVQFWLTKDDATNRESHAKYKQSYTSWEYLYSNKELYRKC